MDDSYYFYINDIYFRCYLEFEHAAGDCGRIPNSMYVALQLSQQKDRLQINLYDPKQAADMMEKISEVQRESALSQGRLNTNRSAVIM